VRFASLLAPVALVSAVASTTTLFVFALGVVLTLFFPGFGREDLSSRNLARKGVAALLVSAGMLLANALFPCPWNFSRTRSFMIAAGELMQQSQSISGAALTAPSVELRIQQLNREMLRMTVAERRRRWKDYLRLLGELKDGNVESLSSRPAPIGLGHVSRRAPRDTCPRANAAPD
jgi:hypothetical protein